MSLQSIWDPIAPIRGRSLTMLVTVAVTTIVWLAVTFMTAPESKDTLVAFYRRTAPSLTGWRPIAAIAPGGEAAAGWTLKLARLDLRLCAHLWNLIQCWCKLLLKETGLGIGLIALGLIAGAIIYWDLYKWLSSTRVGTTSSTLYRQ